MRGVRPFFLHTLAAQHFRVAMAQKKEILLYGSLYSYNIVDFISAMNEAKGSDITVRVNTPGGDVYDTWGGIAKFAEHTGKKTIKVDGEASSMGLFLLCFSSDTECLPASTGTLHRAAYPRWFEESDQFTEAQKAALAETNLHLRNALEKKINAQKLFELKGVTLDQVFDLNNRIDVKLTAQDMLAIGLVNRITPLTAALTAQVEAYKQRAAACANGTLVTTVTATQQPTQTNKMDKATLKAQHPALYAEIVAEGISAENERVKAWMEFESIDPKVVAEGIKGGKEIKPSDFAKFQATAIAKIGKGQLKAESPKETPTDENPNEGLTEEQKSLKASEDAITAFMKKQRAA